MSCKEFAQKMDLSVWFESVDRYNAARLKRGQNLSSSTNKCICITLSNSLQLEFSNIITTLIIVLDQYYIINTDNIICISKPISLVMSSFQMQITLNIFNGIVH